MCRGAAEPGPCLQLTPRTGDSPRALRDARGGSGRASPGRRLLGSRCALVLTLGRSRAGPAAPSVGPVPGGCLGSRGPTAAPELGQHLGLWSPWPAAPLPTGAAGAFGSISACMGETQESRCDGEPNRAGIASLRGGNGDQKTSRDLPNACPRIHAINMKPLLFCLCPDPGLCEKHFSIECLVANCSSNWFSRV